MAKKREEEIDRQFYCEFLMTRKQQVGLNLIFFFVYLAFIILIFHHLTFKKDDWTQLIVPILLFSIPIVAFPMVENWEYKPWQAKAQKYERHYKD